MTADRRAAAALVMIMQCHVGCSFLQGLWVEYGVSGLRTYTPTWPGGATTGCWQMMAGAPGVAPTMLSLRIIINSEIF